MSNNNILTFITDPDDPNVKLHLEELFDMLKSDELIVEDMERGLVEYSFSLNNVANIDQNEERLFEIIDLVSYYPVLLNFPNLILKNSDQLSSYINGFGNITKSLLSKYLKITVSDYNYTDVGNNLIFSYVGEKGKNIYASSKTLQIIHDQIVPTELFGYQMLSDNPMVLYCLENLYEEKEYVPSDINIKIISGIYGDIFIMPVGSDIAEFNKYKSIKENILMDLEQKENSEYFNIVLSYNRESDVTLINELCMLWNTEIVFQNKDMENGKTYLVLKHDNIDFGTKPSIWFENNVELIRNGYIPKITLYGSWQQNINSKLSMNYGSYQDIYVQYGAILAYKLMSDDDNFLIQFSQNIKVNNDYSITLSLPSYDHVLTFRENFNKIYYGSDGLEHYGLESWSLYSCGNDSIVNCMVKRWYVQNIDSNSNPMILPRVSNDSNENVLIFRSPISSYYENNKNPFDLSSYFPNNNVGNNKNGMKALFENNTEIFKNEMKQYYEKCHGDMENVALNKISSMKLEELIELVEIKEKNNPTYCYSYETILKLDRNINPMTRNPISKDVIIKSIFIEWGWRGLFNIGALKGLYENYPNADEKVLPTDGFVNINEYMENKYSVNVGFSDGIQTDLFEIDGVNRNDLQITTTKLWDDGFFLNDWNKSLVKYANAKSYQINITDPVLANASVTKEDGLFALDYLKGMTKI